jgi:hypothetical protein
MNGPFEMPDTVARPRRTGGRHLGGRWYYAHDGAEQFTTARVELTVAVWDGEAAFHGGTSALQLLAVLRARDRLEGEIGRCFELRKAAL